MTITLQVAQRFDSYALGDQIALPDAAALALLKAYPGRYQFASSSTNPSPGLPIIVPAQPNTVVPVVGAPDPSLAVTYGFALDVTSTPKTLYAWSGTAWAIAIQAGSGGTVQPVLQALGLSSLTATVGVAFTATITGQTAGSTVTATSSDGTVLTVANGQVSGTFATGGKPTITLAETLAGATGSPKSTQLAVTVSAAAAAGGALDFSDPNNSALIGAL